MSASTKGIIIFLVLLVALSLTEGECVKKCKRKHGNFQHCKTCKKYVTCDHGRKFVRPCAPTLFWDDSVKTCVRQSSTCEHEIPTVQTTPRPTFNQGNGIVDDAGEENGAITPSPGNNCPEIPSGTTLPPLAEGNGTVDPGECVSSCRAMRNGDYQSCQGCQVYVTCVGGHINDMRSCAVANQTTLEWDDSLKLCVWPGQSTTCNGGSIDGGLFSAADDIQQVDLPQQKVCRVTHTIMHDVNVDGCRAEKLIQSTCNGECISSYVFNGITDVPDQICSCCRPEEIETRGVSLVCTDGTIGSHQYSVIKSCSCEDCK